LKGELVAVCDALHTDAHTQDEWMRCTVSQLETKCRECLPSAAGTASYAESLAETTAAAMTALLEDGFVESLPSKTGWDWAAWAAERGRTINQGANNEVNLIARLNEYVMYRARSAVPTAVIWA
jgi:hypothetical protein